jgi:glutaredoxin
MPTLYYSNSCPHCHTIIALIDERPQLNIKKVPSSEAKIQIQAVPTIVLDDGTQLMGSEAFTYVKSVEPSSGGSSTIKLVLIACLVYFLYTRSR